MKKIYILFLIGMIVSFQLEAKKIEGIILFESDTISVTFNIPFKLFSKEPNYEKMQYKVIYFDSSGKKTILRPGNAKEIRFQYEYEKVRMLSRYNSLGLGKIFSINKNIFLKLETDGKLKLFNFYYSQKSPGIYDASTGAMTAGLSYDVDNYILQKEDGEIKRPKGLTFKKDMIAYFSDCPVLVEKIESKYFRKNDLEFIVNFYNSYCR